jgi:hypothetical protein
MITNSQQKPERPKSEPYTLTYVWIALFVGSVAVVAAVFSPFIFTRAWTSISFRETGGIGDTIGGLTAPILSILNAALVYLAFHSQMSANRILQEQLQLRNLFESNLLFYRDIKSELEGFRISGTDLPAGTVSFEHAYRQLSRLKCPDLPPNENPVLNSSQRILVSLVKAYEKLVLRSIIPELDKQDQNTLLLLLETTFESKFAILRDVGCDNCGLTHGFPDVERRLIWMAEQFMQTKIPHASEQLES